MRTQSLPEEAEQHECRRQVRGDEERDEERVVLVDVPAQQLRQDHAVPEARDGEELGDALQEPEDGRLRVGDQRERERRHGAQASTRVRGPLWNQARTNAPRPRQQRGDAVLDVVVGRSGLVAREEAGKRLGGLDPIDHGDDQQEHAHDGGPDREQASGAWVHRRTPWASRFRPSRTAPGAAVLRRALRGSTWTGPGKFGPPGVRPARRGPDGQDWPVRALQLRRVGDTDRWINPSGRRRRRRAG